MLEQLLALPTLELAPRLLGAELIHESPEGITIGRIVEVEAYRGPEDRAAHSFGGRRTARTEVMFGPPGHLYVYRSYGIHLCCNVVSAPVGKPEAILIRALEPLEGLDLMAARRRLPLSRAREFCNGPGKLTQAMGIGMEHYGHDLRKPPLRLRVGDFRPQPEQIERGPRIGIDRSGEAKFYPWRFWIGGNRYVSR